MLSSSGMEPLLSASMGGRGICDGPTPPTPAPQEARRSDRADCYADIHLRISTLIGEAKCWLHAGYHEAIGSKHIESRIPHGKEVLPGACWIIAPSQVLLHDWEAGMEGSSHLSFLGSSWGGFLFTTRGTRIYICPTYVAPQSSLLKTCWSSRAEVIPGSARDDRWCELRRSLVCSVVHGWRGDLERQRWRRVCTSSDSRDELRHRTHGPHFRPRRCAATAD